MEAKKVPNEWSCDALLTKAQRYTELMLEQDRDEWQFGFWSVLALEMLVRAAVAKVSPTLLADGKDWNNVLYALGGEPKTPKFIPRSADTSDLLVRVESLYPTFTRELMNFCVLHFQRRNADLHTASLPFDEVKTAQWLPQFYASCQCLAEAAGSTMEILFGSEETETAKTLVQALKDDAAKAVNQTINAHRTVWEGREETERKALTKQAKSRATRAAGHVVACPSCGCKALLSGTASGAAKPKIEDGIVVERQAMIPSHLECFACGLKVNGYSKLNACGLGGTYTATSYHEPADYFEIEVDPADYYDDDNNEP